MGKSRRWGVKSLEKQQQAAAALAPRALLNAFPRVALPWAAALLRDCDVERHGVNLFNRDPLLLGRLLITLVSFSMQLCLDNHVDLQHLSCCIQHGSMSLLIKLQMLNWPMLLGILWVH